ncbi:hypothetical protein [Nostoc sp. JL33]|nr:hypothetical protein [Nostoc sp. JL33]MBN3872141.1 hypothetical protein [Nostoc sp. JL33]
MLDLLLEIVQQATTLAQAIQQNEAIARSVLERPVEAGLLEASVQAMIDF